MSLLKPRWFLVAGSAALTGLSLWGLLKPGQLEQVNLPPIGAVESDYTPPIPLDLAVSSGLFVPLEPAEPQVDMNAAGSTQPIATPPRLVGLATRRSGAAVALAVDQSGQTKLLRPGEAIDGWTLASAGRDHAIFAQGGRRERVSLDFANKSGGGSRSSVAPAQQLMDTGMKGEVVTDQ